MLPSDIIWYSIMSERQDLRSENQFAKVEVTLCWREIRIEEFFLSNVECHFRIKLVLDFLLSYQRFGRPWVRNIVVSRATLNEEQKGLTGDVGFRESECALFHRYWYGPALCPVGGTTLHIWEPLSRNLERFHVEHPISDELTEFRNYFKDFEARLAVRAQDKFDQRFPIGGDEMDEKRVLFLTVLLGLSPDSPSVRDFLEWLSSDSGLPNRRTIAEAGLKSRPGDGERIREALQARVAIARAKIERMAQDPTLSARIWEYAKVLRQLEKLH